MWQTTTTDWCYLARIMSSHLGSYRVLKQLGEGGMASAWLAVAPNGDQVVLKIPLETDDSMTTRLHDEAQAGRRVHHPNVVSTLDYFVDAGRPVLVIEFIDGCALRDLRTRDKFRNPLPAAAVAFLGRTISEALCAIHEATDDDGRPLGMLHRDVTASNVLICKDGAPKLIDLGIARSAENQSEKTQAGMIKGTLRYIAPELLLGDTYSPATDLWSLGVCLFEAALGRQMVAGEPVDIFRALTNGSYRTLRPGERLYAGLQDALFALVADKNNRMRNARAAARMFASLEAKLGNGGQRMVAMLVPFAQESSDADPSAFSDGAGVAPRLSDPLTAPPTAPSPPVPLPLEPEPAVAPAPTSASTPAPAPAPKVVIGDTEYGMAATLQMAAVDVVPLARPTLAPTAPGPTLVLPAVDLRPPARSPTGAQPALDLPPAGSPSGAQAAVDVRPPSGVPADPGPTLVLPAVDLRPPSADGPPAPTVVLPSVNPTPVNRMAARVAANGDVLPEGASTLQMPAWTSSSEASEAPPALLDDDDEPAPPPRAPTGPRVNIQPVNQSRSQAPASEEAKPTRVLPIAAALRSIRDDDD